MWRLAEIYRHPVKSLGHEPLEAIALTEGRAMPFDRHWGVAHGAAQDIDGWAHCRNFVTQRHVPRLAQISARVDEADGVLHLAHPDLDDLAVKPGAPEGDAALTAWLAPLTEGTPQSGPFSVHHIPGVAFTDGEDCHVSIATLSSRRALGQMAGMDLAPIRFRMNLWLDGPAAWEELGWEDREVEIGEVRLRVVARCERCNSTNADPATGGRSGAIPSLLKTRFGHMDFGVNVQVVRGGTVRIGDTARVL